MRLVSLDDYAPTPLGLLWRDDRAHCLLEDLKLRQNPIFLYAKKKTNVGEPLLRERRAFEQAMRLDFLCDFLRLLSRHDRFAVGAERTLRGHVVAQIEFCANEQNRGVAVRPNFGQPKLSFDERVKAGVRSPHHFVSTFFSETGEMIEKQRMKTSVCG